MFFFASLYVQEILGYSPLKAGLAFLPVTAGIMVGAGLAQQLIKRLGRAQRVGRRDHAWPRPGCSSSPSCRSTAATSATCSSGWCR